MSRGGTESPWILFAEIALAAAILAFLYFRKRRTAPESLQSTQRIEMKLKRGILIPSEIRATYGQTSQLVIQRFDTDPQEELFEIEALKIYELLPAHHATVIPFTPTVRGRFPLILGVEKQAGILIVE